MLSAVTRSTLASPVQMLSNAKNLAPIAVALFAIANTPTVKAGDTFVDCMNACDKIPADFGKLLCYAGCAAIDLFKKKK